MKIALLGVAPIALLASLALPVAAAQQAGTDTKIQTSWSQPPQASGASWPACSGSITKACILGYIESLTDPTGKVNTVPACSSTVSTNCIGPVTIYTWSPGGNLICGSWSITLSTSYLDGNGTAGTSAPSGAVSTTEPCPFVPPVAPSNIVVSPKP